jgi:hypothetical protein
MKMFTTNFINDDNIPALGLSPIITIWEDDSSTLVKTDTMSETGGGFYKYIFEEYDDTKHYSVMCDANIDIVNRYNSGGSEV